MLVTSCIKVMTTLKPAFGGYIGMVCLPSTSYQYILQILASLALSLKCLYTDECCNSSY